MIQMQIKQLGAAKNQTEPLFVRPALVPTALPWPPMAIVLSTHSELTSQLATLVSVLQMCSCC